MPKRTINIKGQHLFPDDVRSIEIRFWKIAKENPGSPVRLVFGDCGGAAYVPTMDFIYRIIESGVEVKTKNEGAIYSAATLLYLAGKERDGVKGCKFYLHPLNGMPEEYSIRTIKKDALAFGAKLKKLMLEMMEYVESRTHLSRTEMLKICSRKGKPYFFDYELAKKAGIITAPAAILA
jgi:hypothetical protein